MYIIYKNIGCIIAEENKPNFYTETHTVDGESVAWPRISSECGQNPHQTYSCRSVRNFCLMQIDAVLRVLSWMPPVRGAHVSHLLQWGFYWARLPCPTILLCLPRVNNFLPLPPSLQVPLCMSWNSRHLELEWTLETRALELSFWPHRKSIGDFSFFSLYLFAMFDFLFITHVVLTVDISNSV